MILGDAIRITNPRLVNGYWAKNKNGFQILEPTVTNGVVLYCKTHNGIVVCAIEVRECQVTKDEKILHTIGDPSSIIEEYEMEYLLR